MRRLVGFSTVMFAASLGGLFSQHSANGHPGGEEPIAPISGIGNVFEPQHAGYGYLLPASKKNGDSEAEAADDMNFLCRNEDILAYTASGCDMRRRDARSLTIATARTHITNIFKPMVQQSLRDKIFEFVTLQMAALDTTRPVPVTRPSCVTATSGSADLAANLPATVPAAKKIKKLKEPKKTQALKLKAVSAAFDTDRMVSALMLHQQLYNAEILAKCSSPANDEARLNCMDIQSQRLRVRNAFPQLFTSGVSTPTTATAGERRNVNDLENATARLVGAHNALTGGAAASDPAVLAVRGMANVLGPGYGDRHGVPGMDSAYRNALDAATNGQMNCTDPNDRSTCTRAPVDPRLSSALTNLRTIATRIKDDHKQTLTNQLSSLCSASMTPEMLAILYPQVARQMVLDETGRDRDAAKAFFCTSGIASLIEKDDKNSCLGVSGRLANASGVRIRRTKYNFPYQSETDYTVKRNSDGELEVQMTLNFQRAQDPPPPPAPGGPFTVSQADFQSKVDGWINDSNTFYGKVGKKARPKVKFNITSANGTTEPLITISQCYNNGLARSTPLMRYNCAAVNATPQGNWQNSGNLTMDTNNDTIHHEFGHRLGLDDEYEADYYPMNLMGESDSVMNSGDRFYPRHIEQMVRPALRCGS